MRSLHHLLPLLALVGAATAASVNTEEGTDRFHQFVTRFSKVYKGQQERQDREAIFMKNLREMEEHNEKFSKGLVSWSMKIHEYMDYTEEEFVKERTGLPVTPKDAKVSNVGSSADTTGSRVDAPDHFSWVEQGGVTSVKNQGQCGSCAAFAVIATVETCFWQQTGVLYDDLSEQHILDCGYNHQYVDEDGTWGASGCDGAWPQAYIDYLQNDQNGYTQTEAAYPYEEYTSYCRSTTEGYYMPAGVTGMYNKWDSTEDELQDLVLITPVSTSIQATYMGGYSGGVYDDYRCCEQDTDPNCKYNLNHAVTVVGYGREGGKDYWLVKNSWGERFGENGYIKMKRGTGHCGIGRLHITMPYCQAYGH